MTGDARAQCLPYPLGCTTATFGGVLATKLAAMRRAGFTMTELWPRDVFESADGPTVAVELLRENGLSVSAYQALRNYEGAPPAERDQKLGIAEQMMDQMALVGADLLVVAANTSAAAFGDVGRLAEDFARLGELARTRGLRIAYEPIAWASHVRDFAAGWRVVEAAGHPQVGLMLDSFHAFLLETPLSVVRAIPGDKIFLVELADFARSALTPIEISRNYRLFPGEGLSPVAAFMQAVADAGYAGPLSVEIFNAACRAADPFEVAERAMRCTVSALSAG